MGIELRINAIHAPVEHERRAGVLQVLQSFGLGAIARTRFIEQAAVNVGQVGIGDNKLSTELGTILQPDARDLVF